MRTSFFNLQLLCLALVIGTPSSASAASTGEVMGNVVTLAPDGVIVRDFLWLKFGGIKFAPGTRFFRILTDNVDIAEAAGDLRHAEQMRADEIELGDRLLVRGKVTKSTKGILFELTADLIIDAGQSFSSLHWHPHQSPFTAAKTKNLGLFSFDGLSVKFTESRSPDHGFTMSCDEFAKALQLGKHVGNYMLDVERSGEQYSLVGTLGEYGIVAANGDSAPDNKTQSNYREILNRPCSKGVDAAFQKSILAVWRASDEAEPFQSIRGEFDLSSSTGSWKTSSPLPDSEKCWLTKTQRQGSNGPALWSYSCMFPPSNDRYERIVKLVQATLKTNYQPDESAVNANQVLFSDPAKPAWKLAVSKSSTSSIVTVRIVPQQLAASTFEGTATGPNPSGTSRQTPGGSIPDEIERIRGGDHVDFPPIRPIGGSSASASNNGMGAFSVKNDTAYTLTVLFSGPTERRIEVAPSGATSIDLMPGAYKVAARVNAPDVSPSYGEHVFDRSSSGVTFYIR